MCGWADVGSCPPWATSVTWVSLPGCGYLPWVPTVKYKGGLCCGYIGWALLWWQSIGQPGSKLGLFWCPVALPSSLCAGTHCAGACENGAGERQRSMPRVWVRRKSLGSTRHNCPHWHTTHCPGTASGTLHNRRTQCWAMCREIRL